MSQLSTSAIFSPSVARQQLATAKDWNYIDSWLSSKFNGKMPPPFERNNDTLKALLGLAALNETADEERDLLSKVNAKVLHELKSKEKADPNAELFASFENSLTREGQTSLDALAATSVALNQSTPKVEDMGRSFLDLQVAFYDLEQAGDRVTILETHLNNELLHIKNLIQSLQGDTYQLPGDLTKQTIEYQRKSKALAIMLPELKDRVASLSASLGTSRVSIQEVKTEEDRFKSLMTVVKDLETQVKNYHGLPQDTDLARLELESLRVELRGLTQQRDSLFEGLVERESPQKRR